MSTHYAGIAFTDQVQEVQGRYGSQTFYGAKAASALADLSGPDALGPHERAYLAERDTFFLASVGSTGWPYVQHRGGPPGFLRVLDDHTIGWADFKGNLQYVSVGNLAHDDRVSLIVLDPASQQRLKIFGRARVVDAEEDPELVERLTPPDADAVVERGIVVAVEAFDWNCRQHITPRYSAAELELVHASMRERLAAAEAEIATLRRELAARTA
ncbi:MULTISPECIES: pyridoxamine 5'-phosphate oxidase family protein [unclassified Nocardioides]|uniref:pyridoxamine 5'-phosphate oxidase family protein n=1 Tax=unclassified Nocardioides TaxID=2615069 RepID=UPI0006FB28F5|nr:MULTISPECIES: pyridoxamine 5'-phosphate oxidase family protein [unclassified Nocardioides]KRA38919.1 pyridoxamine 5-phosphate oxidase [Nocardioides sp. Root614]KRA92878.1 pyridoxamine 5-phosphate oxidase [Nocardioides sp. Root682]